MSVFLYGMGTGFSLIIAIGAQNAFVLKQGLKRQFVFIICTICAVSDALLIYLGVTGFAKIINNFPMIIVLAKFFGAIFLFLYGLRCFYSAIKKDSSLKPSEIEQDSLLKIIGMCLAFTWLNPHVYLDAVILVGSISAQFAEQRYQFAVGAMLASCLFFFGLGYGARLLQPIFAQPISWKVLDVLIGMLMWAIALSLLI